MRRFNKITASSLIFFFFLSIVAGNAEESDGPAGKVRINWDEVDGAIEYKVRIADVKFKIVLNETVGSNYIDFSLPPGKYRISVGSVNKFYKISAWSDWMDFEIAKTEKKESPKLPYIIRFGIGIPYFQVLPDWKDLYEDSYTGLALNAGYRLGGIGLLSRIRAFRFIGIELDAGYVKFKGKKAFNRIESDLNCIIAGGNLFMITNFNFPVNLIIRSGGGIVNTEQVYQKYNISGERISTGSFKSNDPFYKAGLSLETVIKSNFYIEAGADYSSIFFLVNDFKSIRYFCLFGMRL